MGNGKMSIKHLLQNWLWYPITHRAMPIYAARVDTNQHEIAAAAKGLGATVCYLHTVGKGVPDLLIGWRGYNFLVEIKTSTGKLDELQVEWHDKWRGQAMIIRSAEELTGFLLNLELSHNVNVPIKNFSAETSKEKHDQMRKSILTKKHQRYDK